MKLLILTEGALEPTTRFRVLPYLPDLRAAGFDVRVSHSRPSKHAGRPYGRWDFMGGRRLHDGLLRARTLRDRRRAVTLAREADVVFLQRDLTRFLDTADLEEALARLNPRIVFDIDDALFARPDGGMDPARGAKVVRIFGLARRVTAGNATLRDWAAQAAGRERAVRVPTPVDTSRYTPAPRPRAAGEPVRLGWIGVSSGLPYLLEIAEPLARVTRKRDAVVRIVCDNPPAPSAFPFRAETIAWSDAQEAELLRSFDIGLMPLPDNPWTRGKCGLKLLLYMATALPSVASPVGANGEIVHPETGVLAEGAAAWEEALDRLVGDAALRERLGRAARARAEAEHSVARWAPVLVRALREAGEK